MEKIIKNVKNNNTLYFIWKNTNCTLCSIETNKKIFVLDAISKFEKSDFFKNREIINLSSYLNNKILEKMQTDLRLYVSLNINDYSLYKRNNILNLIKNKDNFIIRKNYWINSNHIDLKYIGNNILRYYNYPNVFTYDLEKDILDVEKDNKKTSLLISMLSQFDLDLAVFQEQCKRGIAPKIVYELIKIGKFIEGKCSLKLINNNDNIYTAKDNYSFRDISHLLYCSNPDNKSLSISRYNIDDYCPSDINFNTIKAIKYGRTVFPINHDNLKYEIEYTITKKVA